MPSHNDDHDNKFDNHLKDRTAHFDDLSLHLRLTTNEVEAHMATMQESVEAL